MNQLDEPSYARTASSSKPRGLANPKHQATPINTIIEDFVYEDDDSSSQSEDFEDGLEFPGDGAESLVRSSSLLFLISVLTHIQHRFPSERQMLTYRFEPRGLPA